MNPLSLLGFGAGDPQNADATWSSNRPFRSQLLAGGPGSDGADGGAWSAGARSMLHGSICLQSVWKCCKKVMPAQAAQVLRSTKPEVSAAWGSSKQPRSEVHILEEACVLDLLAYRYHVALGQA